MNYYQHHYCHILNEEAKVQIIEFMEEWLYYCDFWLYDCLTRSMDMRMLVISQPRHGGDPYCLLHVGVP